MFGEIDYMRSTRQKHNYQTNELNCEHSKEKHNKHCVHMKVLIPQGMELPKVNRRVNFKQKPWLKKYVSKNTKKMKVTNNESPKEF